MRSSEAGRRSRQFSNLMVLLWRHRWLILAVVAFVVIDPWVGGWAALSIVFVPWWIWLAQVPSARSAFWGSFGLGFAVTLTNLSWLFLAIPYPWIELPRIIVVPIGIMLTLIFMSLHGLAFGLIGRLFSHRVSTRWLLLFPIVWAGWEVIRTSLSFGIDLQSFLWSLGRLPVIPELLIRSPILFTLGLVFVNIWLFRLVIRVQTRFGEPAQFWLLLALLMSVTSLSWLVSGDQAIHKDTLPAITIWNRVEPAPTQLTTDEQTDRLTRLMHIVRTSPPGALIVTPENTLAVSDVTASPQVFHEETVLNQLAASLQDGQILVSGVIRETKGQFLNSALIMDNIGVIGWSAKHYLIPFGETLPNLFQPLLPAGWLTPYTNLDPSLQLERTMATPQGTFGFAFCSELFYRTIVSDFATNPDYLIVLANDSHVMSRQFAALQLAVAKIRAVQLKRPVILATTSAQSAIIDASGNVIALSPFGQESVIMKPKVEQE